MNQAPQQRYLKFDIFMGEQGYNRWHYIHCVYFKILDSGSYYPIIMHVDGMFVVGSTMQNK